MDIILSIYERIFRNPTTTIAAIAPIIVGIIAKMGFNVPLDIITAILSALYPLILALLKDHKPTVKPACSGTPPAASTPTDIGGSIIGRVPTGN